jgi:hypothetical protein
MPCVAILEAEQHALDELGARVRVLEELARGHHVRLQQRAARATRPSSSIAFAHDRSDLLRVVAVAVPEDDFGVARGVHPRIVENPRASRNARVRSHVQGASAKRVIVSRTVRFAASSSPESTLVWVPPRTGTRRAAGRAEATRSPIAKGTSSSFVP